jgi:hypothetical protein
MYTLMMIWWCEFDVNWEGIIGMSGLLFMSRCIVLSSLCGMWTFMHSWVNLRRVPHDLKLTWAMDICLSRTLRLQGLRLLGGCSEHWDSKGCDYLEGVHFEWWILSGTLRLQGLRLLGGCSLFWCGYHMHLVMSRVTWHEICDISLH